MTTTVAKPAVRITPRFAGAPNAAATVMDFLIDLIMPAKLEVASARAPLNVALAVDCSSSMNQPAYFRPGVEMPGRWEQQPIVRVAPMPFPPRQFERPDYWLGQQEPAKLGNHQAGLGMRVPGMRRVDNYTATAEERPMGAVPGIPESLGQAQPGYHWVYIQPFKAGPIAVSKMERVKEAAHAAIDALNEDDRIAIVSFADSAKTVFDSAPATAKNKLLAKAAISNLKAHGNTALDAGWRAGATQVVTSLTAGTVNRVLLLTDGRANVGETNAANLVNNVKGLVPHGVTTTCFGVGQDYSEDLLQSMAEAGDGRYYYLDQSSITEKFIEEFSGLSQLLGRNVRLQILGADGVVVEKCLNDFPIDDEAHALPNAVRGSDQQVIIRATLDGLQSEYRLVAVVKWTDTNGAAHQETAECILPAVPATVFGALKEDGRVGQRVGELEIALAKKEAIKALDRGDLGATRSILSGAMAFAAQSSYGGVAMETERLMSLSAMANSGDTTRMRKSASYEMYETRSSRK